METGALTKALSEMMGEKTAFVGIGNVDRSDDGAGVALARLLMKSNTPNVFDSGTFPESIVLRLSGGDFDTVIFIDAVDAGIEAGGIALFGAGDIARRFPQVSTHKISLGTLADLIAQNGHVKVFMLGIQPKTVAFHPEGGLSETIETTVTSLAGTIAEALRLSPSSKRSQLHAV